MRKEDIEIVEDSSEESGLEEEVESVEGGISNEKLMEFLSQNTQSVSPTLNEIGFRQENLEENIVSSGTPTWENKEDERPQVNYDVVAQEQQRIYEINQGSVRPPVLNVSSFSDRGNSFFVDPLAGRRSPSSDDIRPRQIEASSINTSRKLPFEADDAPKYKVDMSKKSY